MLIAQILDSLLTLVVGAGRLLARLSADSGRAAAGGLDRLAQALGFLHARGRAAARGLRAAADPQPSVLVMTRELFTRANPAPAPARAGASGESDHAGALPHVVLPPVGLPQTWPVLKSTPMAPTPEMPIANWLSP